MRYFLILNPGSKGGNSKNRFSQIFTLLDKEKVEYDYNLTNNLSDAYSLSVSANKSNYDVIVAVGGDGTINRVLNGFYNEQGKRISSSKFGVIYTGTSPDFCKSYHIPIKTKEAIRVLLQNNSRKIQAARIRFFRILDKTTDGQPFEENKNTTTAYFSCCANFGIASSIAKRANSGIRKILGDFMGTFVSLLTILPFYKPADFTIKRDGKIERLRMMLNLSVGKTFYIASGIKVSNNLAEDDSCLYNLTIKNIKGYDWLKVLLKIYSGKPIINDDIIALDYCKSIEIYGSYIHPEIEFDGDSIGFLPCQIEMAEDKLDLICE